MKPEDIHESLILFERDFHLAEDYLKLDRASQITYEQAFIKIMRVVEDLLERDFNGLVNILYRIDVSETQLKKALAASTEDPASIITDMIFKREMQKVATRRKYS
jgi:hypothetical protein